MSTGTHGPAARRDRYGHASKVDREAATKHTTVEFVAKADDEQVVTGVVMVPNAVDRQGDFETPETIERFAADFEALYANDSADGGVMHAAWPSEWMDLALNGIAGKTFPSDAPIPDDIETMSECIDWAESETDVDDPAAFCQSFNVEDQLEDGMWVQSWRINDAGLWNLIDDEIIQGFSIGARDVEWRGPIERADLPPAVSIPDEFDEDAPVYELTDGVVREVSAVDTPAVPDAMILAKDDAEKALEEYLGDRDGFIEEMIQRGHDEGDAERVWDVMSRAAEVDGSDSPGKESLYERIGKAAAKALPGMSDPGTPDDAAGAEHQIRPDTAKEGRTLSRANRESAKAAIDANLDLLEDAGVDHGMTRFTDTESDPFDLTEHAARTWTTDDDGTDDDTDTDDDTTESMTDTNDDDNPVLAEVKALREDMEELKSDPEGDDPDDGKDANDDGDPDDPVLAEVKALREDIQTVDERAKENANAIDAIGKQAGFSTQVAGTGEANKNGDGDDDSKDAALREALS